AAMLKAFPEARFLIAIRDPRDVCLSCFMQPFSLTPASSAYLTLEGAGEEDVLTMDLWRALLPRMRQAPLQLGYEVVVANLEGQGRKALDFVGVPWDERVLQYHEHAQAKTVRSRTYADVVKPIFKSAQGRWKHYQKYLEPLLPKLEPWVKEFGYG